MQGCERGLQAGKDALLNVLPLFLEVLFDALSWRCHRIAADVLELKSARDDLLEARKDEEEGACVFRLVLRPDDRLGRREWCEGVGNGLVRERRDLLQAR